MNSHDERTQPVTRPKNPNLLAARTAQIEATLRHAELADRERLVLHAYLHFEALHGGACGQPGVCWPSDGELGAYLGRSDITTRRARRWLAAPPDGIPPFLAVRYVPPFHKLPSGETTGHGRNVITLLEIAREASGETAPAPSADVLELADADAEVRKLEAKLARARARVQKAATVVASARRRSPHNAPCKTTPGWSDRLRGRGGRAGERRSDALARAAA